MDTRTLGNSDIEVSTLALGTWAMGDVRGTRGHIDDNESIAAIQAAIDHGINFFDTAPSYGDGHAETILGRAIHSRRDRVVIATKCGILPAPNRTAMPVRCLSPRSIAQECEASLRRLGVEYIDVYQCHWPDPGASVQDTCKALEQLQQQGKIRTVGLSNYGCEDVIETLEFLLPASLQVSYSMLNRRAARDLIPLCKDREMGVLACAPLARGLLTGRFASADDVMGLRRDDPEFRGARLTRNLRIVEHIRSIAAGYGKTVPQFALRWVLQQAGVTAAFMGARRPSQVTENCACMDFVISEADLATIAKLLEED